MMSLDGSGVVPAASLPPDIKTDTQCKLIRKGIATLNDPSPTHLPEVYHPHYFVREYTATAYEYVFITM